MIKLFNWTILKNDEYNNIINEINALKISVEELKKDIKVIEPASYGTITYNEVYNLLAKKGIARISLSDEYFQLTSKDLASVFCDETKIKYGTWTKENHDCDNFSFALLGYWSTGLKSFAFGYARSVGHAYNIMIDNNKEIWIIEPQNNTWMKFDDAYKSTSYKTIEVLM